MILIAKATNLSILKKFVNTFQNILKLAFLNHNCAANIKKMSLSQNMEKIIGNHYKIICQEKVVTKIATGFGV